MTLPKQQGSKRRFFSYKPHIWRSPITEPWAPRLYFCTFGYGTGKGSTALEAYIAATSWDNRTTKKSTKSAA